MGKSVAVGVLDSLDLIMGEVLPEERVIQNPKGLTSGDTLRLAINYHLFAREVRPKSAYEAEHQERRRIAEAAAVCLSVRQA